MEDQSNLRWWVLLTVIIGTFLGRLDQTVVSLALPKIINDFSITVSDAGWIATAYILANAVFVPVWGKLGDTMGRKKIYIMGFTIFIIGSVLAGISWDLGSMLVFRVVQAVAVSADYPTAMAILAVTFTDQKERSQVLGIWSASFAAAIVIGPLVGGPLIDFVGWRSVFLINLPVGLLGLFMAFRFVKESVSSKKIAKFDWLGAMTLAVSLASIVLLLDKANDWGWISINSLILYATSLTFGSLFYIVEKRHEEPIVDFKFFKNRAFVTSLANNFIIFMGLIGSVFIIPVFVQTFLGYDATHTGYLFIPLAAVMMIAAPIGGSLTGKAQPRYIIAAGTFISAMGMLLFTFIDPRSTPLAIIIPMMVMASGMGLSMAQSTNIVASAAPKEEIGEASSVLALVRNIAGAFGIAIFTSVISNTTASNIISLAQNTVINVKTPTVYSEVAALIILKAQVMSYQTSFLISALLMLLAAAIALLIPKIKIEKHEEIVMAG